MELLSGLSNPEQLLQNPLSTNKLTEACSEAIMFIIKVPISDKRKLECKYVLTYSNYNLLVMFTS